MQGWATSSSIWAMASGLEPAPEHERRCTVVPIHLANDADKQKLFELWAKRTPEQAKEVLTSPDVFVTNQKDKDAQLPKLLKFNEKVKASFRSERSPGGPLLGSTMRSDV